MVAITKCPLSQSLLSVVSISMDEARFRAGTNTAYIHLIYSKIGYFENVPINSKQTNIEASSSSNKVSDVLLSTISVIVQVRIHKALLSASSFEPGRLGWLDFRDLASPLYSLQKFRCVQMRRRAGPVTEISVFATEIS